MSKTKIEYDEKRLIELILYIGDKCSLDTHYGAVKLNKILFYADFHAFKTRGKPITGAEYKKYTNGPAPCVMKRVKEQLEDSKEAIEFQKYYGSIGGNAEKRLLPLRKAVIDEVLEPEEIAIVDDVIEWLRPMTGREASDRSHVHPGWKFAEMNETIPYCVALLPEEGSASLSAPVLAKARASAERFAAAS